MSGLVYFNGILVPEKEVALSIKDRSYLYGEGLFETMKASQGVIPFLSEHLSRLFSGMDLLQIDFKISPSKLEFAIQQTLLHNRLKNAYIRVTVSRENESLGNFGSSEKSNLMVAVKPLKKVPAKLHEEGCCAAVIKDYPIHPDILCQIKSTNYLKYLMVQSEAGRVGAEEGILINTYGRLVEGATSNIFLHDGHQWVTPPREEGVLLGVTRRVLLEIMKKNQIPFEERPVELEELREVKEMIMSNAIREIIPVARVDDCPIGQGIVGENTLRLQELFQEEIQFRLESFESRQRGIE